MVGVIIGAYRILHKLGEGGMGAVYLGQHTLLGRRAAIKVLQPALSARPDVVTRFFNEARAVTSISDPGIVQVFDFGYHTDGSAFLVMEYLEGEPLDRRLARLRRLPVQEALRMCCQLATSLAAAHAQHIVHRDLKPENIFLVHDSEVASGERSKILDFGIAKLSDDLPGKVKTHTGSLMGTPVYMSPEQCRGVAEIDHRSDIYALGCVVFHLLTGRPPFEGEGMGDIISAHIREPALPPSTLRPGVPPSVDALVLRCLAKAPADRFSSMSDLAGVIGQLLPQLTMDPAAPHVAASSSVVSAGTPLQITPEQLPGPAARSPLLALHSVAIATTLGGGSGQLTNQVPRRSQLGLRIAAGVIAGTAMIAIVIVSEGRDRVTPRDAVSPSPGSAVTSGSATQRSAASAVPIPPRGSSNAAPAGSAARGSPPPPAPRTNDEVAPAGSTAHAPAVPAETNRAQVKPPGGDEARGVAVPTSSSSRGPVKRSSSTSRTSDRGHSRAVLPDDAESTPAARAAEPQPPQAEHGTAASPIPARPAVTAIKPSLSAKCSKMAFAAVYNAASPSKDVVRAALRSLNACHGAGTISDAEFDETQAALVARF